MTLHKFHTRVFHEDTDLAGIVGHAGHLKLIEWARKERVILRPEIGAVIRAGYDPVLPSIARDPAHAPRLMARLAAQQ